MPGDRAKKGEGGSRDNVTWSIISLGAYTSPSKQLASNLQVDFGVQSEIWLGLERVGDIIPTTDPKRHLLSDDRPS